MTGEDVRLIVQGLEPERLKDALFVRKVSDMDKKMSLAAGKTCRNKVLRGIVARRKNYVDTARVVAAFICREEGTVTVDQLRDVFPPPDEFDARVCGSVFTGPMFNAVGYTQTKRVTSHARTIRVFELAE